MLCRRDAAEEVGYFLYGHLKVIDVNGIVRNLNVCQIHFPLSLSPNSDHASARTGTPVSSLVRNLAYSMLLCIDLSGPQKSSKRARSHWYMCSMASHQRKLISLLLAFRGWSLSFLNLRSA